jgi:DHA2 family multidrug resistance protein
MGSTSLVAAAPPLFVAVETVGVVLVATIGATISSILVDLGIADIAGGRSISVDQASWIACTATMAEVAAIPVAALLVRATSLRTVVVSAVAGFGLFAAVSLAIEGETALLLARAGQSFFSGTVSVLLFVAVMANLHRPAQRAIGLSIFAFATTAPTALAPVIGGWVTDHFGWRGLYYFDLAWALPVLVLAWRLIPAGKPAMRLAEIDWLGYALLALGLMPLVLVLKQGDRFHWFEDATLAHAAIISAIFLPLGVLALFLRKLPLLDVTLIAKPTFGWAIVLATFYRFGLVMVAFVVPQALMRLQGFRMPEIADATISMFWAQCVAFPLAWLWASRFEARTPLALGLALFAVGALMATRLTPAWQGMDFRATLIVIGLGQGFFLVPTIFYATRDVAPAQGPTAAAFFNLSRIVGQTFGTGMVAALITEREKYHSAILISGYSSGNSALADRLSALTSIFYRAGGDRKLAGLQAWQTLSAAQSKQAFVLAFADAFLALSVVLAISALLVLMLPPLRAKVDMGSGGESPVTPPVVAPGGHA